MPSTESHFIPNSPLPREVLAAIIANTTDAILALDPSGKILVLNKEAETLYATSSQQAVGHSFAEICMAEARLDSINDIILHTVQKPNELLDQDIAIQSSDGTEKFFNIRTRLLTDIDNNQRLGLIVVLSDITQRIQATRERAESGMFLFTIVMSLLIAMGVNGVLLKMFPSIDIYSLVFGWSYTIVMGLPILAYMLWMKKPLHQFGWNLHNWRQSTFEGLAISAVFFVSGLTVLMILGASEGKTLVDFINFGWIDLSTMGYTPHSILQELVFRGIILGALVHMFRDYPKWLPLLIGSLLFGFIHTHLGLAAIGMTFAIGFLFGWLYLRHGNIIGVSIVHIILGYSAFIFGLL